MFAQYLINNHDRLLNKYLILFLGFVNDFYGKAVLSERVRFTPSFIRTFHNRIMGDSDNVVVRGVYLRKYDIPEDVLLSDESRIYDDSDFYWCLRLTEPVIRKFFPVLNWSTVLRTQYVSEELIDEAIMDGHIRRSSITLTRSRSFSEEFIRKHLYYFDKNFLAMYQDLSEKFIEDHLDILDLRQVYLYQVLSDSFLGKYLNKFGPKLESGDRRCYAITRYLGKYNEMVCVSNKPDFDMLSLVSVGETIVQGLPSQVHHTLECIYEETDATRDRRSISSNLYSMLIKQCSKAKEFDNKRRALWTMGK